MSEELVAIAYEFSPLKANLIRSRLEADGIECFLSGETLASVAGPFSHVAASWEHPGGNIEIRVRASAAAAAKAILQEIESVPADDEDEIFVARKPSFGLQLFRVFLLGWLAFALTMFISGATENRWLGIFVGVVALVGMSFLAFKKPFNSKR